MPRSVVRVPSAVSHTVSRRSVLAALLATGGVAVRCDGFEVTPFPEGLEPLSPVNRAPAPTPTAARRYPEAMTVVFGEDGGTDWVHARAYVNAPLAATWAALRDPEVCVDRRKVARWSVTRDVEPRYHYSYRIHNVVNDVITVEFDITWRHGVVEGTVQQPHVVGIRYQKTAGTTFISILEGSVIARRVDEGTTALEFIERLRAAQGDAETIESYLRDYYASVLARTYGRPLPTY